MVLFYPMIQVLDLTDLNGGARLFLEGIQGRSVGATLIDRHLVRKAVRPYRLFEKAPGGFLIAMGGQQKVDRLSLRVDSAVEVFLRACDLDIRFIHPSARACRPGAFARCGRPPPIAG
jgi:hypothetical protein